MHSTCLIEWEQTTEKNKNWYQQCLFDDHIVFGCNKSGTPNKEIYSVIINVDCMTIWYLLGTG